MRLSIAQPRIWMSDCLIVSGSPAAMRIICSTISTPVTSSVTGCSTCSLVFHLEKVEILILIDDEFDGAGGVVVNGAGEGDRLFAHRAAEGLIEQRGGGFLDHLLIAALD